jgi:hypothetical protein
VTTVRPSARNIALPAVTALACYVLAYVVFRSNSVEVRPRDGHAYVIVPAEARWLHYVFRPLMYADATLTGMRFHIGPHREE